MPISSRVLTRTSCASFLLLLLFNSGFLLSLHAYNEYTYDSKQTTAATWDILNHDYNETSFTNVAFLNETHGWVVGEMTESFPTDIVVLFTDDGGQTWKQQLLEHEQYVVQIEVIDENNVWITGYRCLFYTHDGGKTWSNCSVAEDASGTSTVEFYNTTHGWTSTNSILYKTTDGGQTWESVPGWNFEYDGPRSMVFLSSLDMWAIGWFGIYHSIDGGNTWEQMYSHGGWDLSFTSENVAWAVSDESIMHMTDGKTWYDIAVPSRSPFLTRLRPPYLTDVQFVDTNNGWIVGDEVPIMYTPDGGFSWYEQSTSEGVYNRLYAVDFVDLTHGWAVGSGGYILRTVRGNSTDMRLWTGMNDPIFLTIIGGLTGVVVVVVITLWIIRSRIGSKQRSQQGLDL